MKIFLTKIENVLEKSFNLNLTLDWDMRKFKPHYILLYPFPLDKFSADDCRYGNESLWKRVEYNVVKEEISQFEQNIFITFYIN